MYDKKLGEILIDYELVSETQLAKALHYQKEHGLLIGEALVKLGYLTNEHIIEKLAQKGTKGDIKDQLVTLFSRLYPNKHPYTNP